ncbi:hypothetical protein ACFLT2_02190 [Acidobacteriota bacterium]
MRKWALIFVGLLIFSSSITHGAELPAQDAKVIEAAGIPIFPGATFAIGNLDTGYRFATAKSPAEVRQWYQKKLSDWSLLEEYGSWILYKGQRGLGMSDVMSKLQVMIQKNENLPQWHSLKTDMTTEIVIMIPKTE